jgi:segregation and condensation protein B
VSRKRGKKHKAAIEAIPDDILAEGSRPVGRASADAISTVEDVVTTDDIATTADVVTADDVVATTVDPQASTDDGSPDLDAAAGDDAVQRAHGEPLDDEVSAAATDATDATDAADASGDGDDDDAGIVFPTSAATMDAVQIKHLVEALIFASDRPLTVQRLRQLTRVGDVRRLEQALVEIFEDYRERGLILQQVSGGYQFRTRTQFSAWVQQLIAGRPVRLSRAQLETLAIIAYRQPITRPEIDDIRGVDSSATLKLLIDRMLIRVLGKREEVGRPMLYGTTKEFLDFFSLGDLRELPTLREYSELTAESRKVMSDRLGLPPDGGEGGGGADGSGGSGDGGGGGDGGGPIPGFDDGMVSDDGGAPAGASATDLADAVATFLSAADAVDRSNAAAVADPDDRLVDEGAAGDELAGHDAASDEAADDQLVGDVSEASMIDLAGGAGSSPSNPGPLADEAEAGDASAALTHEPAGAAPTSSEGDEAGAPAMPLETSEAVVAVASTDEEAWIGGAARTSEDGQVDADAGWPAGSRRFAVIASSDDRPVERPVMDSNVIGADTLDDGYGEAATAEAATAEARHVEPAAE